jgi:hypothetical protein
MIEVHEARSFEFSGSFPEDDKYGRHFVSTLPFLVTDDFAEVTCHHDQLWVRVVGSRRRVLSDKTHELAASNGQMALYLDGKFIMSALVRGTLSDGFGLGLPCPPTLRPTVAPSGRRNAAG